MWIIVYRTNSPGSESEGMCSVNRLVTRSGPISETRAVDPVVVLSQMKNILSLIAKISHIELT